MTVERDLSYRSRDSERPDDDGWETILLSARVRDHDLGAGERPTPPRAPSVDGASRPGGRGGHEWRARNGSDSLTFPRGLRIDPTHPDADPEVRSAFYRGHSGPLGVQLGADRQEELEHLERAYAASPAPEPRARRPVHDGWDPAHEQTQMIPVQREEPPGDDWEAPPRRGAATLRRDPARDIRPATDQRPATGRRPVPDYRPVTDRSPAPRQRRPVTDRSPAPQQRRPVPQRHPATPQRRPAARRGLASEAAYEDERFLEGLRGLRGELRSLVSSRSLWPRLPYMVVGFAAIGPLAFSYAELMPLYVGAAVVLLPAAVTAVLLALRYPSWGHRALVGYIAGIVATGIYDLVRLALAEAGLWDDPIPGIGRLLLANPDANFVWGYLWRFLGNGAGMGLAFAMLPWRGVRAGVIYGTMICLGLFATLAFAPPAQSHFFPLTPTTALGAMAGHWVYGSILGWLTHRRLRPRPAHRPAPRRAVPSRAY